MDQKFPTNVDGHWGPGYTTQGHDLEIEANPLLSGQTVTDLDSFIGVQDGASFFHSNTNGGVDSVPDTAIEGTWQQDLVHPLPGSLQWGSTSGPLPAFWGQAISSGSPGYQTQQWDASVFLSSPANIIFYSNAPEQMVLETQPEGFNQLITNSSQQFPQTAPGIFPYSQPVQIEREPVFLGNTGVMPEAQHAFMTQNPQADDMPSREDSGSLNGSQNILMHPKAPANDWERIGPMFNFVYHSLGCSLKQTAEFLELVFGFRATLGKYEGRMKRGWPNLGGQRLRKNKSSSAKPTTTKTMEENGVPGRDRSYRKSANYNPCPQFLTIRPRVCIPEPLEPAIYKNQIILLRYTDKYVTGFFDSPSRTKAGSVSEKDIGNRLAPIESSWQRLLNCCQGMSALMRKGKNFVLPDSGTERPKQVKEKDKIRFIERVIENILEERVFGRLDEVTKDCSPFVLSHLWSICHILRELSLQIGYSKGVYVAVFLRSLYDSLNLDQQSVNNGLADIINHLVPYFDEDILFWSENEDDRTQNQNEEDDSSEANGYQNGRKEDEGQEENQDDGSQKGNEQQKIRKQKRQKRQKYFKKRKNARKDWKEKSREDDKERQKYNAGIKNIIQTTCQCATRAFSTRRDPTDPNVLKMWANYCRFWDTSALNTTEFLKSYQGAFKRTESFYGPNHDYTIDVLCNYAVAAYYVCHEKALANTLARDLWNQTQDACRNEQPSWSTKTRGMAEAASILGLSVCIYHENMYKGSRSRTKWRLRMGLKGKAGRRKYRSTLYSPPPPDEIGNALTYLDEAVKSLARGDWECRILAQDMAHRLAGLLLRFCGPEEEYRQAANGHRERGDKCLSEIFFEAAPVSEVNTAPVIEHTIFPAQLHWQSWPPYVGSIYGGSSA